MLLARSLVVREMDMVPKQDTVERGTENNIHIFYKSCLFYSLPVLKANFLRVHHLHLFLLLMQPQGF